MALKLYNTLTRKKQIFEPLVKGKVGIYTCGPTVYSFAHIGNFRAYMAADILKRYLKYSGYSVKHVMNITDVDDKTIKGSAGQKITLAQYTGRFVKAFFEDLNALNIEPADIFPKATEHIKEMVEQIKKLEKNGLAYRGEDNSWYYSISKFKNYGKLSRLDKKGLKAGARVKQDNYEKSQAQDFALWKAHSPEEGDVFWETEIGKGRPGWHIECSAMNTKYLGDTFDIHTGGIDLRFPHHENEIAQAEGATKKPYVRFWFHNEHLLVDGKKMSKSLGNFYTLRDLLGKGHGAMAIRYLLLSTHYRQQSNFTFPALEAAKKSVEKLNNFIFSLKSKSAEKDNKELQKIIKKAEEDFEKKLNDDLNISEALAVIFTFMNDINKMEISKKDAEKVIALMKKFDSVLGVIDFEQKQDISDEIEELIKQRDKARASKDWQKADKIRDELKQKGIELIDTKEGTKWKKV